MNNNEIKEKIKDGALRTKVIIEVIGRPKEKIQEVTENMLKEISSEFTVLTKELAEPKEISDKFYSAFIEAEILFPNFVSLIGFIFDRMPSSIEIIEPAKITEDTNLMNDLMNDLAVKLHQFSETIVKFKAMNSILKKEQKDK